MYNNFVSRYKTEDAIALDNIVVESTVLSTEMTISSTEISTETEISSTATPTLVQRTELSLNLKKRL